MRFTAVLIVFCVLLYSVATWGTTGDTTVVGPTFSFGNISTSNNKVRATRPSDRVIFVGSNGATIEASGKTVTFFSPVVGGVVGFRAYSSGVASRFRSTFLTQTDNPNLPNSQAMGALATGIVKNTTTTGVQSIATPLVDYEPVLPLTTLGDTLYQDGSGRQRLPGNTTAVQKFLSQTGDGVNSAAPSWQLLPVNGTLTYYFQNIASAIAGDKKMLTAPYTPKTTLSFAALGAGTTVIQNFATDPGFSGLTFIPAGTFIFHVHASQSAGTKNTTLFAQFWEVSSTGVDIAQIGTNTESTLPLTGSEVEYELAMVNPNTYTMGSAASRVVCRISAVVDGGGSTPTAAMYVGGTADSHIELPANSVDATSFVPYSGATQALDMGANGVTASVLNTSGNLAFTGTGNRITGDFSNATLSNRVLFQSSITNSATSLLAVPSGSATTSRFIGYNLSDPTNGASTSIAVTSTLSQLTASAAGTGSGLPLTINTVSTGTTTIERIRINTGSGNIQIGATGGAETAGAEKLQVTGAISASGAVLVGGGANTVYYCNGGVSIGNLCRGNGCSCVAGAWVATSLKID